MTRMARRMDRIGNVCSNAFVVAKAYHKIGFDAHAYVEHSTSATDMPNWVGDAPRAGEIDRVYYLPHPRHRMLGKRLRRLDLYVPDRVFMARDLGPGDVIRTFGLASIWARQKARSYVFQREPLDVDVHGTPNQLALVPDVADSMVDTGHGLLCPVRVSDEHGVDALPRLLSRTGARMEQP